MIYPDGTRDSGVYNPDGDLVMTYADGSSSIVREDGSETFTDPYGITTIVTYDEEGRRTQISSDGWTSTTSPDGSSIRVTYPDGYVENTVISSGSACSSGKIQSSYVLKAMGLNWAAGKTIRISSGWDNKLDDLEKIAEFYIEMYKEAKKNSA